MHTEGARDEEKGGGEGKEGCRVEKGEGIRTERARRCVQGGIGTQRGREPVKQHTHIPRVRSLV